MKKLLITGFDPFNGAQINPSWEAVKGLADVIGDYELHKVQLPTVYEEASEFLLKKAESLQPVVILCIGQAAGRDCVTPERIAVNIREAKIADNRGRSCHGQRIDPAGNAAYFSTVPVEAMADAILAEGLPGAVSNTAGTFVCNDVLYNALARYEGSGVRCGFIHVPWLPEQGTPSLPLSDTIRALTAAIRALDKA